VYVPVTKQAVCKTRVKQELRDLVTDIERRPELLGHVIRIDQTRVGKYIFKSKMEGGRKIVRPRLISLEDGETDIRAGCEGAKGNKREEWTSQKRGQGS
jgi:hypothetical protein